MIQNFLNIWVNFELDRIWRSDKMLSSPQVESEKITSQIHPQSLMGAMRWDNAVLLL